MLCSYAGFYDQFQTKLSKSENLIGTMLADVMPSIRSNLSHSVIVLELLPLLCDVIQPTLRPVSTSLIRGNFFSEIAGEFYFVHANTCFFSSWTTLFDLAVNLHCFLARDATFVFCQHLKTVLFAKAV